MSDEKPALKKLNFRCPTCGREWHKWVPITDTKLRRFCPAPKDEHPLQLVGPYNTERKVVKERKVKTTVVKSYW